MDATPHDYAVCIASPGREDVLLTLSFPSDHAATSYAHKIEDCWVRKCEVAICAMDGRIVYMTDSRKRRSA